MATERPPSGHSTVTARSARRRFLTPPPPRRATQAVHAAVYRVIQFSSYSTGADFVIQNAAITALVASVEILTVLKVGIGVSADAFLGLSALYKKSS